MSTNNTVRSYYYGHTPHTVIYDDLGKTYTEYIVRRKKSNGKVKGWRVIKRQRATEQFYSVPLGMYVNKDKTIRVECVRFCLTQEEAWGFKRLYDGLVKDQGERSS